MKCLAGLLKVLKRSCVWFFLSAAIAAAQPAGPHARQFPPGTLAQIQDLPPGRFRDQVERLPAPAQQRAFAWLNRFHFTEGDLTSLHVDTAGGIFYADEFSLETGSTDTNAGPVTAGAAVPVSPFPAGLIFHSRPGAPNVLFLNFAGENVTGTAWNSSVGRTVIPAVAFNTDSDDSTFSDAEQVAIKRVWERVAEDYAPFNIDVTTERPATFNSRTAEALITRNTDANGATNPSSTAGGVAYVEVFGGGDYATYRPAWIYFNNLASTESYIAEAASHEIGHNLGLSHDGKTDGTAYYGGHGTGDISWGPIMGTGYNRNVSQWSKGEYYLANNTEDDLAIIAGKISYRTDDYANASSGAAALVITGGTNIVSTTPETDPANANPANKGVIQSNTDVDVFSFSTGDGPVKLLVNPWIMPSGTRGGNLDVSVELRSDSGVLLLTNNPATQTIAQIQTNLAAGLYYLYVRNTGAGDPLSSTPSGYTSYGSIGQFFISGYVEPAQANPAVQLTTTVNNAGWGTVTPTNGTYAAGTAVQVLATPAAYFRFSCWTNGAAGTNDPLTVVLNSNTVVGAVFDEILTTNHPTPEWWLAAHGFTNNFETAVSSTGANGMALWQSYIAGLNPNDPNDRLLLALHPGSNPGAVVLSWNPVADRTYTLWQTTNLLTGFAPLSGAVGLPASITSFTNSRSPAARANWYRLQVQKP